MTTLDGNRSAETFSPKFQFVCSKVHLSYFAGLFNGGNLFQNFFNHVMLEIVLFSFFTQFIRFLLKPLRQPKVVAEMIAAILLAPSILGQRIGNIENVALAQYAMKGIGVVGFVFFIFVSGVQIDVSLIKDMGRENTYIALTGIFVPVISAIAVAALFRSSLDKGLRTVDAITVVSTNLAITTYPVIHLVLKELNLLSSEMGRKAVTIVVVEEVVSFFAVIVHEVLKQAQKSYKAACSYVLSLIVVATFLLICVRRATFWIISNTPKGKPVDQLYVVLILVSVIVMVFITDVFGLSIARGALWLGLIIPSGPPLGTTIVERSKAVVMDVMLPFTFSIVWLNVDIFAMAAYGWQSLFPFFAMVMTGYVTKFLVTFLISCHFGVQWKDSLSLSLIMNLRGLTDLFVLLRCVRKKLIGIPMFTMAVFLLICVTGISAYFITVLYDPTTPYLVTRRRTIQHTPPGSELMLVACVPGEGSVPTLTNLIEISNPSPNSPLMVYAIHLIELIGQSIPFLKDHEEQLDGTSSLPRDEHSEKIYNALKSYEAGNDYVTFRLFTARSPKRTMYQDICYLALIKVAGLIIIPLNKNETGHRYGSELYRDGQSMHSVNEKVLTHSPCSVAIFVHQRHYQKPGTHQSFNQSQQIFTMLFLGGADAREALAYADRIVANPVVILKVVKFTPAQDNRDSIEKKLDDGMLRWFWERNESNERVVYSEVLSKNGEDTLAAIHELAEAKTDLWIVGRKQGINPVLLRGLIDWNDRKDHELGIIGEFLTSDDFVSEASVLVFHQQILRG